MPGAVDHDRPRDHRDRRTGGYDRGVTPVEAGLGLRRLRCRDITPGPRPRRSPASTVRVRALVAARVCVRRIIASDPQALKRIESIVHPLVAADREAFKAEATADIVVLDIPLLFETGGDSRVDAVAVVSVDPETQARRVLDRGTMTREQFELIRAKQTPDAEKRARADYVIITDTLDHAREQVQSVIADIRSRMTDARDRS